MPRRHRDCATPGRYRDRAIPRDCAMPGRRPAANLLAALALVVALAGCAHTVAARQDLVKIAITEYRMIPQSVTARAGVLTLYVHNYGRLTHNLTVMSGSTTEGSSQPLQPGQVAALTLYLTPGKYLMLSTILSDRDLGIYGTLTVTG